MKIINPLDQPDMCSEPKMTHEQFAEITGKQEGNVRRTMNTLFEKGIIDITQFEKYGEINGLGHRKKKTVLCVNERDSYIVMAQLSPKFTAQLVDEWKVLKEEKQNGVLQLPNFNNPAEAARAWAEQYETAQLAIEGKKRIAEYSERQTKYIGVLEKQHATGVTIPMFCKSLNGVNTQQVQNFLADDRNWMHKQSGSWVASAYSRDKYLSVTLKPDHFGIDRPVCYLTERGATLLYKYYCKRELPMKKGWNGDITPQKYLPIIGEEE